MRTLHLGPTARRAVRVAARLINPLTLLVAGRRWMPIVGVLLHRGRIVDDAAEDDVGLGMRHLGDSFVMPLTFSESAAWYRNIRAAGWAVVRYMGREYTLVSPEVIDYAAAAPAFPRYELLQFQLVGINEYLRMRQAPSGWSPSTSRAPLLALA
jgi:hypothetical protein